MRIWEFWVYIITNQEKTVLYVGATNNLEQRLTEHYLNKGRMSTFTGRYNYHHLLYYEFHRYVRDAFAREHQIKGWSREKEEALIATVNPEWKFLNAEAMKWPPPVDASSRGRQRFG